MSLQYYPHEDAHAKPTGPPEGWGPSGSDLLPLAAIELTLAMSIASLAIGGEWLWASVMLAVAALFNLIVLPRRRNGPDPYGSHPQS
jgi:hypothetical protein